MAKKSITAPKTSAVKEFIKHFEKLGNMHSPFNVYSDFLAVSAIALSNAVNFNNDREQEYLRIINKYNTQERALLPKMLAAVVKEMQNDAPHYRDVLGELFHELNLHDHWKAQFFTPQNVSDMIGLMNVEKAQEQVTKCGYVSVLEPCAGGGSMVLGLVNAMFEVGLNPCKELLVTANDIDTRCVHMAYIQLSLAGVPAVIQHKNTLTGETLGENWYTPIFILDGWIYKLRSEKVAQAAQTALAEVPKKPVQLTLF